MRPLSPAHFMKIKEGLLSRDPALESPDPTQSCWTRCDVCAAFRSFGVCFGRQTCNTYLALTVVGPLLYTCCSHEHVYVDRLILTPGLGLCADVWGVRAAAGQWAHSDSGPVLSALQRRPAAEPKLHRTSDPVWCDWGPVLHPELHTGTPPVSLCLCHHSQEPGTAAGGRQSYWL